MAEKAHTVKDVPPDADTPSDKEPAFTTNQEGGSDADVKINGQEKGFIRLA